MADVTPEFARFIVGLGEAFGIRLTEARIRIYADQLADLSADDLNIAAARAIRELRYFPQVAELRSFVEANTDDAALLAWSSLNCAARTVGAYQSLVVDDPATAFALQRVFGSWSAYCVYDAGPELASKKQEFLAAFRHGRRSAPAGAKRFAGLCESDGSYRPRAGIYAGHLLATGDVRSEPDDPMAIGAGVPQKALTDGTR